ncbi:MAG: queuosine biosynthesis protein QueE [Nitrospirae bacterium]|nr:MAG: queuosine biosynthesis protein QueE [Nitrospirota bacterium]
MHVCEIFASIQGESTHAGRPCVFVRLAGCNLRCSYCDTVYSYEEGSAFSIAEILTQVAAFGIQLVEVTGGEPLLQTDSSALVTALCNDGYEVLIETNGSQNIKHIDPRAKIIVDIKTPSSGMADRMLESNLDFLKPEDEIKFVIASQEDYAWARHLLRNKDLASICTVLFSPAHGMVSPSEMVQWILDDHLPVRLNLQLHKYIWPPHTRGV